MEFLRVPRWDQFCLYFKCFFKVSLQGIAYFLGMQINLALCSQLNCRNVFKTTLSQESEQTLPAEETEIFWSAGGTPEDLFRLSGAVGHLLCCCLLEQQLIYS